MTLGSFHDRQDAEDNGAGFVEISNTLVMRGIILFIGTVPYHNRSLYLCYTVSSNSSEFMNHIKPSEYAWFKGKLLSMAGMSFQPC